MFSFKYKRCAAVHKAHENTAGPIAAFRTTGYTLSMEHFSEEQVTIDQVFGPVPSRRLGRSLGVNNIPPKYCSYACVYCQLGNPQHVNVERRSFYEPDVLFDAVSARISRLANENQTPDFITIVPDGEPTLDQNLGTLIDRLTTLKRPDPIAEGAMKPRIAVITNGSLLYDPAVRDALTGADGVSVKIDAPDDRTWRRIDRPARALRYDAVIDGIRSFRSGYGGFLATETMLVADVNDDDRRLQETAAVIGTIQPQIAYISIPTRPPSEEWVHPPSDERIIAAYRIFAGTRLRVELNTSYEIGRFGTAGSLQESILSTAAVHPIPETALREMVDESDEEWSVVDRLVKEGRLNRRDYRDRVFYLTNLR